MADPDPVKKPVVTGEGIALQMVEQLSELNARLADHAQHDRPLSASIANLLDELNGHFEVISRSMELLLERKGKKLGLIDLAECWVEADEEIMGEDDDDQDGDIPVRH
jgi:hypothetical protein